MVTSRIEGEIPNLLSPESLANPYPAYAYLRENSPVCWSEDLKGWLVTRYADVKPLLQDTRLSLGGGVDAMFKLLPEHLQREFADLRRHLSLWLGTLPAVEHSRLRSVMSSGFAANLIGEMRNFVYLAAGELLLKAKKRGQMEAVTDFAHPLPAIVIGAMFGAPTSEQHLFKAWSESLTAFLGFGQLEVEVMRKAQTAVAEMTEYLRGVVFAERGDKTCFGLTSYYLMRLRDGGFRSEEELLSNLVLLLFAGHETTSILISNMIFGLLTDRKQLARLCGDESLVNSAVEEFLRFESPVQMVRRSALSDMEIGGRTVKAGEMVWLVIGAANRDPKEFDKPDRLTVSRDNNHHLAFGNGAHYCLGSSLSRLEGQEVLKVLLPELPAMSLGQGRFERVFNPTSRGFKSLPVIWS